MHLSASVRMFCCAALLLWGCGSQDLLSGSVNSASIATPSNLASTRLNGRVLNEQGQPVSGVRVIARNRLSSAQKETLSGSDGGFALQAPPGVYDLGLDREGDSQTCTCFYGPVDASTPVQNDFILHSSRAKPASTIMGKLWRLPGLLGSQRKVNLRSGHLLGPTPTGLAPLVVTTTTGADGSFEQSLNSDREVGVDLEIYDGSNQFDEFIPIGKRSKPCYVEFISELPLATNQLRSDESELPLSQPQGLAARGILAKGLVANDAGSQTPEGFQLFDYNDFSTGSLYTLTNGRIPVGPTTYALTGLTRDKQFFRPVENAEWGDIRVDSNGMWWWKYAVNLSGFTPGSWYFTDETGDSYLLGVISFSGNHKVSYNSDKPAIIKVDYATHYGPFGPQ